MSSANRVKSVSSTPTGQNGHVINVTDDADSLSEGQTDEDSESEQERDERVPCTDAVESPFLDDLIVRLMTTKVETDQTAKPKRGRPPCAPLVPFTWKTDEILRLCDLAIESLRKESVLLTLTRQHLPVVILGDIHGQFRDLRGIFQKCGSPHLQSYLFLGDYVDRGLQGIEVMALLLATRIKYPSKVFLLRGNHEDGNTCMSYGFYEECQEKFIGEGDGDKVFRKFLEVFAWLPAAAIIDQTILCMHGGISPHLRSLDDIRKIERPRPIPPFGLMTDLMWSDPNDERDGWSMNPRGISYTFSTAEVESACRRLGVELIVRAHQMTAQMRRNGYSFFAGGRLLTIFSAPNYLNQGNDGCLLRISRELKCSFVVLRVPPMKPKRSGTERVHARTPSRVD